jgi:hypothetical protein
LSAGFAVLVVPEFVAPKAGDGGGFGRVEGVLEGKAAGAGAVGAFWACNDKKPNEPKEAKGLRAMAAENRATRHPIAVIANWFFISNNLPMGIPSAQAGKIPH